MNENINLYKILKGHENETFYSPVYGDVNITFDRYGSLRISPIKGCAFLRITSNGHYDGENPNLGEMIIFPSKDQRDWNKWIEEQKSKVPKTWDELNHYPNYNNDDYCVDITGHCGNGITRRKTPIEKSALALLKIHQLIEVGYGGNITNEEWKSKITKWKIWFDFNGELITDYCTSPIGYTPIAFHSEKQQNEFLSYPENVQLLKDYYGIS